MIERTEVIGTQAVRPRSIEFNHNTVYGRRDIQRYEQTIGHGDEAETVQGWKYRECQLTRAEYDSICNGQAPSGGWTDFARWFQRGALLADADTLLAEADNRIEVGDDPEGKQTAYKKALLAYKDAIRATKDQPEYPAKVAFPDLPSEPQ